MSVIDNFGWSVVRECSCSCPRWSLLHPPPLLIAPPWTISSISWVAQRVPDDHVAVVANMYTIREVDLDDTFNFLGRPDMWDLALADGLWDSSMPKDFTRTFSDGVSEQEFRP